MKIIFFFVIIVRYIELYCTAIYLSEARKAAVNNELKRDAKDITADITLPLLVTST